jgi:hypothetical protein
VTPPRGPCSGHPARCRCTKDIVKNIVRIAVVTAIGGAALAPAAADDTGTAGVLSGRAAFTDWSVDRPGLRRHIAPQDQPAANLGGSYANGVRIAPRAPGQAPSVPPGFAITLFAERLHGPRELRAAPNGDVFVAESGAGRVRVLRPMAGRPPVNSVFVSGLTLPFGIAFYPPGPDPRWVYVANSDSVVRFAYRNGDLAAGSPGQTIVPQLPVRGHVTRDLAFSRDGTRMFVSVGSGSNVAEGIGRPDPAFVAHHPLGAIWGSETDRANVLVFDPDGSNRRVYATGIRNCVGLVTDPADELWCSTNERDAIGDDVPSDYITRVREGAFYGWPWYYLGSHEDPRHAGERPDLRDKVTVPDVLLQAHSASLGLAYYDGSQFPPHYRGSLFAALHGSWNRSKRTGSKVIRVIMRDGQPTGEYEDFVTGFTVSDTSAWGRPVGVAVTPDGSLYVSDDAGGTIWQVTAQP